MAANLVPVSYEQCRREYFENEMQKAKNKVDYWVKRAEKAPSGTQQMEAHNNASNAGWEVNYYKDALAALDAIPKWISVDAPPKNMRRVFVYTWEGKMAITYYNPLSKTWDFNHDYKITHWMPLPEAPKEDTE